MCTEGEEVGQAADEVPSMGRKAESQEVLGMRLWQREEGQRTVCSAGR